MNKFIIKRILICIPMMLVVIAIILVLVSFSKVDPGKMKLGTDATPEKVYEYNEAHGFYDPLPVKFVKFVGNIFKGDFGISYYYDRPVWNDIMQRWPHSLRVTFLGLIIAMTIGIPLGVLAAVKQYSLIDRIATTLSMFLSAIPVFAMSVILMYIFSYRLKLVPASGIKNGWKSWVLPCATLGIFYSARFLRFTRSTMLETIRQDYVQTARAKGSSETVVIWKHAFRNALLPLITVTGTTLGTLIGGVVVIETVFVIPGLGTLVVEALSRNDIPLVLAAITILAFTFLMIMLVVDIMYAVVDPRIRAKYRSTNRKKRK